MISTIEPKVFLNDKIAKKIFKNEKLGKKFSARIISDLIGADYEEVYNNIKLSSEEIAFSSLTINNTADSLYHDNATYFNIEINAHDIESKPKQLESYVYQLYLGQLHSYEDYNKIKKIVQINIDAYDFYGYNEFIYNIFLTEQKHHFIASDSIQIYHLNLDFLRQINYNDIEENQLMKDLYFLICGLEKLDLVIEKSDKLMKDVIDESKKIAGYEKMHLYLTDEQMIENDRKHYIEIGEEKKMHEMIVNFYNKGVDIDTIASASSLSVKDIKKIIGLNKER